MEYPISLDVAISLVNNIRGMKINALDKVSEEEKSKIEQEISMLNKEEKLLYGADDFARLSVMDKAIKVYSPIVKRFYEGK